VIEAESQAVLNTLAKHDFQDALKKSRRSGNDAYTRKGTTSSVIVASRPKVIFWPDSSASPGNYRWPFTWYSAYLSASPMGQCKFAVLLCILHEIGAVYRGLWSRCKENYWYQSSVLSHSTNLKLFSIEGLTAILQDDYSKNDIVLKMYTTISILILGVCILLYVWDQGEGCFPSTQRYCRRFLLFF
jgi:hypothetical protein